MLDRASSQSVFPVELTTFEYFLHPIKSSQRVVYSFFDRITSIEFVFCPFRHGTFETENQPLIFLHFC